MLSFNMAGVAAVFSVYVVGDTISWAYMWWSFIIAGLILLVTTFFFNKETVGQRLEDNRDLKKMPSSFKVKYKDDTTTFTLREQSSGEKEATKVKKSKGSLAEAEEYAEALRQSLEATGKNHKDPEAEFSDRSATSGKDTRGDSDEGFESSDKEKTK